MSLKFEISIIKFLQKYMYTDEYNIIDRTAKVITGRTYRNIYIFIYLLLLVITNDFYKIIYIPKIYMAGFLSRTINLFIKKLFKRRRPFVIDPTILINSKVKKKKDTYSLPSNSIQTSLIFYKVLFDTTSIIDNYTCNILLFLIVLINASAKIMRGLHFPSDILLSVLIFMFVDYLYSIITTNIIYFFDVSNYK